MSFLRRLSNAILPSLPSASGSTPRHVPRRATETFHDDRVEEEDDDDDTPSRASWEMSDSGSVKSSSGSSSGSSLGRKSFEDSDSSESDEEMSDKYDMMTRHLWSVGDRSGWFRDADSDGLVSIR
jgi:hypothetical protein